MNEPFAVNTNHTFPVQFAENYLEAGTEELGQQRVALLHSLFNWYAKWVSAQCNIGLTALIRFLRFLYYFDVVPLIPFSTRTRSSTFNLTESNVLS